MWSSRAEQVVRRLMAAPAVPPRGPVGMHATRLGALPIGASMWADYYLRPDGDMVVVGEDEDRPDEVNVYSDRLRRLTALVMGSRRYSELREFLPERKPDASDCWCLGRREVFGPDKVICPICGGVGWVEAEHASTDPAL
jgi:hypothetical protein